MLPGSHPTADAPAGRSGGKILKSKRTAARTTPYDRPIPPSQSQPPLLEPETPSWLIGLVSPAKFVAGGATKILSSLWNPKSWASHSSSSSDSDSESEDDSGDDENPSDEIIELNQQQKGSSSQKSETLQLIEELLMLEQYSREECDRLIEIINSRVVDHSTREDVDAGPSRTNNETPDIRSQAIMEAKKWVAENKFRSGLKSKLDNGNYALKSHMTPQATEGEVGSPIDVAKSYMKARPPWASPINHESSPTPSILSVDLFKERTPYSSGGATSFPSAKRDYLSAGSWNIQEEIRRVRTKATEDMLSSHQPLKLVPSTLKHHTPKHFLANEKSITVVERDEPINLGTPKSVDEIVNLAEDGGTPSLSDMRTARNDLPTKSHPTMPDLEQYEGIYSDKQQTTRPSSDGNELEKEEDERNLHSENNRIANDKDQVDKNCFLMTESPDIPFINNSQQSFNTNNYSLVTKPDGTNEKRAVTRASRNTRSGKGRGKQQVTEG